MENIIKRFKSKNNQIAYIVPKPLHDTLTESLNNTSFSKEERDLIYSKSLQFILVYNYSNSRPQFYNSYKCLASSYLCDNIANWKNNSRRVFQVLEQAGILETNGFGWFVPNRPGIGRARGYRLTRLPLEAFDVKFSILGEKTKKSLNAIRKKIYFTREKNKKAKHVYAELTQKDIETYLRHIYTGAELAMQLHYLYYNYFLLNKGLLNELLRLKNKSAPLKDLKPKIMKTKEDFLIEGTYDDLQNVGFTQNIYKGTGRLEKRKIPDSPKSDFDEMYGDKDNDIYEAVFENKTLPKSFKEEDYVEIVEDLDDEDYDLEDEDITFTEAEEAIWEEMQL